MFACSNYVTFYKVGYSRSNVKTAALLAFLFTPSTVLFAASEDGYLSKVNQSTTADTGSMVSDITQQPAFRYPVWPDRGEIKTAEIPPPPPGPYMSSALSDYSLKGLSFEQKFDDMGAKGLPGNDGDTKLSDGTFSPDKPWSEFGSSRRWMPDNGYHYVTPDNHNSKVQKYSYTEVAPSKRYQQTDQAYTASAKRTVPDSYVTSRHNVPNTGVFNSRNMPPANAYPEMNKNPYAAKAYTPHSRAGSLYNDPAMNRFDYRQAVPMNRM